MHYIFWLTNWGVFPQTTSINLDSLGDYLYSNWMRQLYICTVSGMSSCASVYKMFLKDAVLMKWGPFGSAHDPINISVVHAAGLHGSTFFIYFVSDELKPTKLCHVPVRYISHEMGFFNTRNLYLLSPLCSFLPWTPTKTYNIVSLLRNAFKTVLSWSGSRLRRGLQYWA